MSSTSSSPPPETIKPLKRKKNPKEKTKKSSKSSNVAVTEHGKDEGTNPDWNYVPPTGTLLLDHDVDSGEFDWDTVKNEEDVELWLIRVPDGVKPKYLENLKIDAPSSSHNGTVGVLHRKHRSYDVWSVGDNEGQPVGGEEIRGLTCLLPRKKKNGKLYKAPKPIARHLVLSAQDVIPTLDPLVPPAADTARTHQNPPRQSYPKEVLKHRFMPYGSLIASADATSAHEMAINMEVDGEKGIEMGDETLGKKLKESKGKKRKVEGDTPKKSKKAKTTV